LNLEQFGWSDFVARQCEARIPPRVASACREQFVVWTESGEMSMPWAVRPPDGRYVAMPCFAHNSNAWLLENF
jgi:hypothetical protein